MLVIPKKAGIQPVVEWVSAQRVTHHNDFCYAFLINDLLTRGTAAPAPRTPLN